MCVCVYEREKEREGVRRGAKAMHDAWFIASQAHLFVFYTSFRLRQAGSAFPLWVTQFHNIVCLSPSLSNNITFSF